MNLHIYTAPKQPATNYVDRIIPKHTMRFRNKPNRLLWVRCCYRPRPAKNVVVQVFYDAVNFWCAPGKGCKSEKEISRKLRAEWKRRSDGQKKRRAREKTDPNRKSEGIESDQSGPPQPRRS